LRDSAKKNYRSALSTSSVLEESLLTLLAFLSVDTIALFTAFSGRGGQGNSSATSSGLEQLV
jgi:hypothetical protein